MKKRLISIIAVIVAMVMLATASTSAVTYDWHTPLLTIVDYGSCTSMQAMAVGSKYIYTVKAKAESEGVTWTKAVIYRTEIETGSTIKLKNGAAKSSDDKYIFNNLGHANDMCVTDVQGKSTLFITGKDGKIVALQISGTTANQYATYTVKNYNTTVKPSGIAVYKNGSVATFLLKEGDNLYTAKINKAYTGNQTISASWAFHINRKEVTLQYGSSNIVKDFSKNLNSSGTEGYDNQGITVYNNKLYVTLARRWRDDIKSNHSTSAILVYENVSGAIQNLSVNKPASKKLSFEIFDTRWCLFEFEGCGIHPTTGKLYFNTNSRVNINGTLKCNYDMISSVVGYTA